MTPWPAPAGRLRRALADRSRRPCRTQWTGAGHPQTAARHFGSGRRRRGRPGGWASAAAWRCGFAAVVGVAPEAGGWPVHGALDLAAGVGVVPEAGGRPLHGAVDLAAGVGVAPEAGDRLVHGTLDLAAGVGVAPEAGDRLVHGALDLAAGVGVVPEAGLGCVATGRDRVVEVGRSMLRVAIKACRDRHASPFDASASARMRVGWNRISNRQGLSGRRDDKPEAGLQPALNFFGLPSTVSRDRSDSRGLSTSRRARRIRPGGEGTALTFAAPVSRSTSQALPDIADHGDPFTHMVAAFRQGLKEEGYIDGQNDTRRT